ncbi:type II toxin-antitoxin system RelE/ParE family toxin [Paracoccus rhizosphaerae]|uniref:Type II toxin-antitoxin system RelE/ParE family toxin n=2 Tax=Paracoccus rhizosphaerae TaxID=1133347 RepID=A0ABV6CJA3_9RHOB|nr:type II toxin-antitoxin system RelE/ParE family toxin [Paracoccus rhizosphaerae]
MTEEDRLQLNVFLSHNPDAGDLIPGTGGARKLRIPLKGKGKSGGARVVTYYCGDDVPVFLLDVYAKGDKINLSQKERNELKQVLSDIADAYRASCREKTKSIGRAS